MNPRDDDTIYWDGGAKKIAAWKEQHLFAVASDAAGDGVCKENWICNALELSTLEMDSLDDEADSEPCTTLEKSKLDYVLNK